MFCLASFHFDIILQHLHNQMFLTDSVSTKMCIFRELTTDCSKSLWRGKENIHKMTRVRLLRDIYSYILMIHHIEQSVTCKITLCQWTLLHALRNLFSHTLIFIVKRSVLNIKFPWKWTNFCREHFLQQSKETINDLEEEKRLKQLSFLSMRFWNCSKSVIQEIG